MLRRFSFLPRPNQSEKIFTLVASSTQLRYCSPSIQKSNNFSDFQEILHFTDFTKGFLKEHKLDTIQGIENLPTERINEIIRPYYKPKADASSLEDVNIRTFALFTKVLKLAENNKMNSEAENEKVEEKSSANNNELKYFLFASVEQGESLALRCAIATGKLGGPEQISLLRDDTADRSALFIACMRGHLECVKNLIELGIDVGGPQARGGYTCLRIACEKNQLEIVKLLLRAGANPNEKNISEDNHNASANADQILPIHVVATQGFHELVEPLVTIGKANVNQLYVNSNNKNKNENVDRLLIVDPLVLATQQGHVETVVALLEHGADVTFVATVPDNSEQQKSEFMKALLQDNLRGNHDDEEDKKQKKGIQNYHNKIQQRTAISIACDLGHANIVKAILRSPLVSMGTKTALLTDQQHFASRPDLCTPLCSAVMSGHANAVREILSFIQEKNKSSPQLEECKNLMQIDGATPLFIACQYNFPEIVAMLIQSGGVDPNIPLNPNFFRKNNKNNNNNKNSNQSLYPTPLGIAIQEKNYQIVQILLRHAAETGLNKNLTMTSSNPEENKKNDDTKKSDQDIPQTSSVAAPSCVFVAAANNDAEMVQLLVDFNCDAEMPNESGLTPIAVAVHNGYRDVVRVLLRRGVSIEFEMGKFKSLGQLAMHKGHAEIFQLLAHHESTPAEMAKQERDKQKKIAKKMWQI